MFKKPAPHKGRLRRLAPEAYRGDTCIHWSMTIDRRKSGWLDELFHSRLREILLHCCVRYGLVCPVYTLMPDHGHFLLMGISSRADQRPALRMLRKHWNFLLPEGVALQSQGYDHLLREEERERDLFITIAHYILENPVRAGLIGKPEDWKFSGSVVPGYPSLHPHEENFWESLWLAHAAIAEKNRVAEQGKLPRPG